LVVFRRFAVPVAEIGSLPVKWSAAELRRLPPEQRDAILAKAAAMAESDYRLDRNLTDFEAFGEADLHGHSSNTESR
jgi:hypothetical protein